MKSRIFIFLYLIVGAVPYFGAADKVDTQLLYLNFLNFINILFIIFDLKKDLLKKIRNSINNIPVLYMSLFFIWSCITVYAATNKVESIISLSEIFTLLLALIFLIHHFTSLDKTKRDRFILAIIIIICSIEIISVYIPYIYDILRLGEPEPRSLAYRGISGSVNVMSYSMLLKLPFILYYSVTKKFNRVFLVSLTVLVIYAVVAIFQTRSALLALLFIFITQTIFFSNLLEHNFLKSLRRLIIPIFLPFVLSTIFISIQSEAFSSTSIQDRVQSLSNLEDDVSVNSRFRYYEHALQSIKLNPILGIGVGNWEIESVKYDRKNMYNYTVPYHVHNDYLEILAESGIPAVVFYFGPIFIICFLLLKFIFSLKHSNDQKLFYISLLCALSVYLIDSLFNFPQARVMQQMNLIFLFAISCMYLNLNFSTKFKSLKLFSFLIIILSLASAFSSVRVYESSKDHYILLRQFNINDFSTPPLKIIEKMRSNYPNIGPTAMPTASMKALHYLHYGELETAVKLFKQGSPHSPHLYMSETFLGYTYHKLDMADSALFYSKLAFDKASNDPIHFGNYLVSALSLNDSILLKEAYQRVPQKFRSSTHDEIYLAVTSALKDPASSDFILDGIDINYKAGNDKLKKNYYSLMVGSNKMLEANFYYLRAVDLFDKQDYESALIDFQKAADLNPYELAYFENIANSYMQLGNDEQALDVLNDLIEVKDSKTDKALYLRGLVLYGMGEIQLACDDLFKVNQSGYLGRNEIYSSLCNARTIIESSTLEKEQTQ
jgi:O-antigen ligase